MMCDKESVPVSPNTAQSERESNGKFAPGNTLGFKKGNKLGKGHPWGARQEEFRAALLEAIQTEDVSEVAQRLLKQALDGNLAAIKELLDRILPKDKTGSDTNINLNLTQQSVVLTAEEQAEADAFEEKVGKRLDRFPELSRDPGAESTKK